MSEEQAFARGKLIAVDHFLTVRAREILQIPHFPTKIGAAFKQPFLFACCNFEN